MVAGTSGAITHPNALRLLKDSGWDIRLGQTDKGIFHPKLLVVGNQYSNGGFNEALGAYFGSGNFTAGGLFRNVELGCVTQDTALSIQATDAFTAAWLDSHLATDSILKAYEELFSQRLRTRTANDLVFLEIAKKDASSKAKKQLKKQPVLNADSCSTVWVGLESFTGEHTFQVEIPGKAGVALNNMLGSKQGTVDMEFSDGSRRNVVFKYYSRNGMYRLNIPNDVPLVDFARGKNKCALVVTTTQDKKHFYAEIIKGDTLEELQDKSFVLGTWGETVTRKYGWF